MTTEEIYNIAEEAYNKENYEDALKYYQQIAAEDENAQVSIPLCYLSLASEVSALASNSSNTETMVRGQQKAISLLDASIRTSLKYIKEHSDNKVNCALATTILSSAFNSQYVLIASGLTIAYKLTKTTTTIEKTMMGDTVLWEEIIGADTVEYVSLVSSDIHDYHVFGPDEKTKRVQEQKAIVLNNAVQAATLLTLLGRPYDAHILRASIACEMADCENGDRSMLLAADWFIWMAEDVAQEMMSDEDYKTWREMQDGTISEFMSLEAKYNALLRSFRKEGRKPALHKFFQANEIVPSIESCQSYMLTQESLKDIDKELGKGDWWPVFLSIFAQAATVRIIPVIVFSSVISLFMGGLLSSFAPILKTVWLIITLIIAFIRSLTDSEGISGKDLRIYQLIMLGTAIVFSINFFVGIAAFIVLKVLSSKYK